MSEDLTENAAGENRREHPRLAHQGKVSMNLIGGRIAKPGAIIDLSLGGCLLRMDRGIDVDVGAAVEVNLHSNFFAIRASGRICHCDERESLLGIQFTGLSPRAKRDLGELIDDLIRSSVNETASA